MTKFSIASFSVFFLILISMPAPATAQVDQPKRTGRFKAPILTLVMRTLDKDQDEELSAEECASASEVLMTLDRNQSGDLSINEIGGPGPFKGMLRNQLVIRVLDIDGDLALSAYELAQAGRSLQKLDRDGDHRLSKHELTYEKPLDPAFDDISAADKRALAEYMPGLSGEVMPGTDPRASEGYLLIHETSNHNDVQMGRHTYMLNDNAEIVQGWFNTRNSPETSSAHLLDNGLLVRTAANSDWLHRENYPFGAHGTIEIVDWNDNTLWSYEVDLPGRSVLHHDFEPLPNGNILVTAYVAFTVEEAMEMGFNPELANGDVVWFDSLIELIPDLENQTTHLAWQWNSWDHVVQDKYPDKPNYGEISENPDRIDINANYLKKLPFNDGEIHHINALSYHAGLDQLLLSSAATGEIWVIDHSTTRAEAASDEGGKYGKGGRLLYRWGNPKMIGQESRPRTLFWQSDAKWVDPDSAGSARVLLYNTGLRRDSDGAFDEDQPNLGLGAAYTDILEISLPVDDAGVYDWDTEPVKTWSWNTDASKNFYSPFSGGVSRLPNGHTLIVQSATKRIIELTPEGERVLDFRIPGPGRIFTIDKITGIGQGLLNQSGH